MFSAKTQKLVAPYRLWMGAGNCRYLMHGQRTPGHNNGTPVRSVKQAIELAAKWREAQIEPPYLYPDWPAA